MEIFRITGLRTDIEALISDLMNSTYGNLRMCMAVKASEVQGFPFPGLLLVLVREFRRWFGLSKRSLAVQNDANTEQIKTYSLAPS